MNPNVTLSALLNKAKRAGSSEDTALQEALGSHLSTLKSYGFDASLQDAMLPIKSSLPLAPRKRQITLPKKFAEPKQTPGSPGVYPCRSL